ncbi:MAG TPA: hypothetical protein VGC79_17785 [Polyangiaceae bacterium]
MPAAKKGDKKLYRVLDPIKSEDGYLAIGATVELTETEAAGAPVELIAKPAPPAPPAP